MSDTILVVNCGSSSLKVALFDLNLNQLTSALAERLGKQDAFASVPGYSGDIPLAGEGGHREAFQAIVSTFRDLNLLTSPPVAIGHRVVHGGETFREAALINDDVRRAIEECAGLAPLHNPVNLTGIEATTELFPEAPQVAVFDTAFHQTLPRHAYLYAVPYRFYRDWGVRRYGFHGTSHNFMATEAARLLGKVPGETSIISAHLGNGCSITAIRDGRSVDTSMGLTPLEGLVMGTRSGDIDPGLFDFLKTKEISAEDLHRILNNESGLLGLSEKTNDMRTLSELAEQGHEPSLVAIEVFCFRLARYISAMMASLSELDALVFTGGIGENSAMVRIRTLSHLKLAGFAIEPSLNQQHGKQTNGRIDREDSRFKVMVIPTNEERVIASEALQTSGAIRQR
ncbi:acetate kinase [uncultured Marinobacter sp.]|uniref:acetate/propionate family kinase n=1 Tax=uncultured Marinobacter sp. TaxID=187379 RepID=UPI002636E7A0|nr:acetate kinase [uncultured Marinobacter sp.]